MSQIRKIYSQIRNFLKYLGYQQYFSPEADPVTRIWETGSTPSLGFFVIYAVCFVTPGFNPSEIFVEAVAVLAGCQQGVFLEQAVEVGYVVIAEGEGNLLHRHVFRGEHEFRFRHLVVDDELSRGLAEILAEEAYEMVF